MSLLYRDIQLVLIVLLRGRTLGSSYFIRRRKRRDVAHKLLWSKVKKPFDLVIAEPQIVPFLLHCNNSPLLVSEDPPPQHGTGFDTYFRFLCFPM